jgi:hypothetical protein
VPQSVFHHVGLLRGRWLIASTSANDRPCGVQHGGKQVCADPVSRLCSIKGRAGHSSSSDLFEFVFLDGVCLSSREV